MLICGLWLVQIFMSRLSSQCRECTVGRTLNKATYSPIFMQFTGQNNGGSASSAFLSARKCNRLARNCIMNTRDATCVGTQTSEVPTRVSLLLIFCSVLPPQFNVYYCHHSHMNRINRAFLILLTNLIGSQLM